MKKEQIIYAVFETSTSKKLCGFTSDTLCYLFFDSTMAEKKCKELNDCYSVNVFHNRAYVKYRQAPYNIMTIKDTQKDARWYYVKPMAVW